MGFHLWQHLPRTYFSLLHIRTDRVSHPVSLRLSVPVSSTLHSSLCPDRCRRAHYIQSSILCPFRACDIWRIVRLGAAQPWDMPPLQGYSWSRVTLCPSVPPSLRLRPPCSLNATVLVSTSSVFRPSVPPSLRPSVPPSLCPSVSASPSAYPPILPDEQVHWRDDYFRFFFGSIRLASQVPR